jgi:predicted transcriptional regulator
VIAHEIGHLELHEGENQIALCDEAKIDEIYDRGTEQESNAFATELLMPRALWSKRVDVAKPDLDLVSRLAEEFQVSFTAAAIRFAKLCPERCAVVFSRDGVIKWSAAGADFRHWIPWGSKLDPYSLVSPRPAPS